MKLWKFYWHTFALIRWQAAIFARLVTSISVICAVNLVFTRYWHWKIKDYYIDTGIRVFYIFMSVYQLFLSFCYLQLLQTCHASWWLFPAVSGLNSKRFCPPCALTWHPAGRVESPVSSSFIKIKDLARCRYMTPLKKPFATGKAWRHSTWSFTSRLVP